MQTSNWRERFDEKFPAPKPTWAEHTRVRADVLSFIQSEIDQVEKESIERAIEVVEKQFQICADSLPTKEKFAVLNFIETEVLSALKSLSQEE